MEMASGCMNQEAGRMPGRPIRGPHGGWQKQEIALLQKSIEDAARTGESLRSVFDRISRELGRKPNSIRNFYYAQIRSQDADEGGRTLPFETFSPQEVEQLIARVLCARAQGLSVRACVRQLADGDRSKMLRYQNKYRSTVRTRPDLVRRVMDRLTEQGAAFVSPYASQDPVQENALPQLKERAEQSGDPRLAQLFSSLDYLMELALRPQNPSPASAMDTDAQRRADRLSARNDMLRIALDDEQTRHAQLRSETEGIVTLIKEYIALPEHSRKDASSSFCQRAADRLSAVECALMQPEP
ncbi:MAG: hypothetical protein IJD60_08070 [Clostridia bacterium]|nr:hypothetical protein [Clostridia bacterium]